MNVEDLIEAGFKELPTTQTLCECDRFFQKPIMGQTKRAGHELLLYVNIYSMFIPKFGGGYDHYWCELSFEDEDEDFIFLRFDCGHMTTAQVEQKALMLWKGCNGDIYGYA